MKRLRRYRQVSRGEWIQPVPKGYRMKCCICGYVHVFDFRLSRAGRIQFRAFPAIRETRDWQKRSRKFKRFVRSFCDCLPPPSVG